MRAGFLHKPGDSWRFVRRKVIHHHDGSGGQDGNKNALEWFVNEQREDMASMDTLLRMVKRAGESGLFFVENFLLQGGLAEAPAGEEGGAT